MSQRQFCLFPERRDEQRAALHGAQAVARDGGEFGELLHAQIAELAQLLRMTDIVLVPSLREPQGMVMLESMACGCVTISSNREGIDKESVEHERTGFLPNRPDDSEEALARLEYAIEHLDTLGAMRAAAVTRFDWNVITARLEDIYLDTTGKARAA